MWREPRWIAILLTLALQLQSSGYAANTQNKRVSTSQHIRVVSVTPDAAGNFVLLSTQRSKQLPFPIIRYMPAPDGRALMTVDFSGALFEPDQSSLTFDQSPIKQVRIGQIQSYPPIMRISMLADRADAFNKVDFRSSPGSLTIKLPDADGVRRLQTYEQPPKPAPDFRKPSPKAELRGPIVLDTAPDAKYIAMEESPQSEPEPKKTPKSATGLKKFLKKLFTEEPPHPQKEDEAPPVAPPIAGSQPSTAPSPKPAAPQFPVTVSFLTKEQNSIKIASNHALTYKTFTLKSPDRLVIDLMGVNKADLMPIPAIPTNGWAKNIRVGNPDGASDITRIVLDLAAPGLAFADSLDEKSDSLIVSLQSPAKSVPHDGLIVLDAGHGGTDPGAQRGDVQEKELTLGIVGKLKRELESRGLKVRLTRAEDTYVSLEDRVKITNSLQPDAFVSVHINSLETNNHTTGIETYYQNEQSKDLAKLIHNALVTGLNAPDRGVRKARFYVINHTPVPAILAEVGFISNKEERDKLISSDYQRQVAASLADGVMLYLSERGGQPPIARNPAPSGSASASGTIPTTTPSASAQSFTQNLHSPKAQKAVEKRLQATNHRALASRQGAERRKTNSARQQLKFKKNRLATRGLGH